MEAVKTDPLATGGITWEVTLRKRRFTAVAPGLPEISGDSYAELEKAARRVTAHSRVRVEVPFVTVLKVSGRHVLSPGTATGIHAGSNTVLSSLGQVPNASWRDVYLRPMSAADETRCLQVLDQLDALMAEKRALMERYCFPEGSLYRQVTAQIAAQVAGKGADGEGI